MDDHIIWENIRQADVNALQQLHDRYYLQLLHWTNKYVGDYSLSEELVSDCFVKIWTNRNKIIIEKSIRAYLYFMLRNLLVSYLRKNKNALIYHSDNLPDLPDEVTEKDQEFYAELYLALGKIPDQRRKILEMAAFESMTYKEIATRLNISVNTVKTQIGRAYQFLKDELDPKNFLMFYLLRRS